MILKKIEIKFTKKMILIILQSNQTINVVGDLLDAVKIIIDYNEVIKSDGD